VLTAAVCAAAIVINAGPAWSQVVQPRTPGNAAKAARQDAREAGRDVRGATPQTRQEARQAGREARADVRQFDAATARGADLGLWFRAGANGLTIADIAAQGAISKIGFREGDQIVSINGQPVMNEADFTRLLLAENLQNQAANVIVIRNGQRQTLAVQPSLLVQEAAQTDPWWQWGMILDDRDPNRMAVLRVFPRTPAFYWGLRPGDVITGFGGQPITSMSDLALALQRADGVANLNVLRNSQQRQLDLDFSAQTRTALRPNLDGPSALTTPTTAEAARTQRTPATATPATPGTIATPGTTVIPGTTPALPRVSPASPATPGAPGASPTGPTIPSAPGSTPATPAAPPAPTTPAPAPGAGGTGGASGTGAGGTGAAGSGT